jgi:hypothetical protein
MRLLSRSAVRECANSFDRLEPYSGANGGARGRSSLDFEGTTMRAGVWRGRARFVLSRLGLLARFRVGALLLSVGIATLIPAAPPAHA